MVKVLGERVGGCEGPGERWVVVKVLGRRWVVAKVLGERVGGGESPGGKGGYW